jgi:heme oxygenase
MPTITERLKAESADLHHRAEHAGFTHALFKGRRPIADYIALLGQMLLVHDALENALGADVHPAVRAVFDDDQRKAHLLRQDLADLGALAEPEPLPATIEFVNRLLSASPLWRLGVHYVLEGSTNGNRVVAAAIRKAYNLDERTATRYLDPYGVDQRAHWLAFKHNLDALDLSEADQQTLIDADLATFRAIIDIHGQLDRATIPA